MSMQGNLALCCKALLPILSMGRVVMTSPDEVYGGRPLLQLTRCLTEQPDKVTHLELRNFGEILGTRRLMGLPPCLQCPQPLLKSGRDW